MHFGSSNETELSKVLMQAKAWMKVFLFKVKISKLRESLHYLVSFRQKDIIVNGINYWRGNECLGITDDMVKISEAKYIFRQTKVSFTKLDIINSFARVCRLCLALYLGIAQTHAIAKVLLLFLLLRTAFTLAGMNVLPSAVLEGRYKKYHKPTEHADIHKIQLKPMNT